MRITISLTEEMFDELLRLTKTENETLAVKLAVEDYVRRKQMRELAEQMGNVDILDNDAIEKLELEATDPVLLNTSVWERTLRGF